MHDTPPPSLLFCINFTPPERGRLITCYQPVPLPTSGEGVRGWCEVLKHILH